MEWSKLFTFLFKRNNAEEWKAINEQRQSSWEEIKYLKDEYKKEVDMLKQRIQEFEEMQLHKSHLSQEEIDAVLKSREEDLKKRIEDNEWITELREKIIFLEYELKKRNK